jgi:hypothetical protein
VIPTFIEIRYTHFIKAPEYDAEEGELLKSISVSLSQLAMSDVFELFDGCGGLHGATLRGSGRNRLCRPSEVISVPMHLAVSP